MARVVSCELLRQYIRPGLDGWPPEPTEEVVSEPKYVEHFLPIAIDVGGIILVGDEPTEELE